MIKRYLLASLLWILLLAGLPQAAAAHAVLVSAEPTPGSKLNAGPPGVILLFNERVEDELYFVKVYDQQGKSVTSRGTVLQPDHKGLRLQLPELSPGLYTVSYKVVSTDGHPISSSYTFSVGHAEQSLPADDMGYAVSGNVAGNTLFSVSKGLVQIAYYFFLMGFTGSLLWRALTPRPTSPGGDGIEWQSRLHFLAVAYGLTLLLTMVYLIRSYADSGSASMEVWKQVLTGTSAGLSLLTQAAGLAAAILFLNRSRFGAATVGVFILAAKSMSGHMYGKLDVAGVLLNAVHLSAAALWTGGLLQLAVLLKNRSDELPQAALHFSRWALWSMLVLLAGGTVMTLLLLPHIRLLTVTLWGKLLLAKLALVLLVWLAGGFLRRRLNRRGRDGSRESQDRLPPSWRAALWMDISLMAAILLIVSVLTGLSPLPPSKPYAWHEPGGAFHLSASLSPNVNGVNRFEAELWATEGELRPKSVKLLIKSSNRDDFPPLQYELPPRSGAGSGPDEGVFRFGLDEVTLPFAGEWVLEVRVMDTNDDETVYRGETAIY